MLAEKIDYYFNKYPELRVLFLFDAEGDYRFDFETMEMPERRKVIYGANDFYLKVKLNGDWLSEKVVLYLPMKQPETKEEMHTFPLLDLLFANKGMQPADSIGEFMEKYGLQRHQRGLAEKYIPFLKARPAQEVLKPYLNAKLFNEEHIIQGLLSHFLKLSQVESWEIILMRLLTLTIPANEGDWNRVQKRLREARLEEPLLAKIKKLTGIVINSWSLVYAREVFDRIKYNLFVQSLGELHKEDPYKAYSYSGTAAIASINLLHEKLLSNARYSSEWLELLNSTHSDIHEKKIVEVYGPLANYYLVTSRLKWAILWELLQLPQTAHATIQNGVEKLSAGSNEPLLENTLNFLLYAYRTVGAIKEIKTYILDKADQYVEKYTEEFYKIDQTYRKAIWYYYKIDFAELTIQLNWDAQLALLNDHYRTFLEKLNREWLKCWNASDFRLDALSATSQYNFYKKEVEPSEQKLAVIISDALRYEVGVELMNALNSDPKNVAQQRFMLASVPSKTSVGMANLLPGKDYKFSNGAITIDDRACDTIERRSTILQRKDSEARAVKFGDVMGKPRVENRDLFKGKVVYIYHDVIDARGDRVVTERDTFSAVEQALQELTRFIKLLHASFNVSKVIVTADHGFLYNDFTIEEKDKEKGISDDPIVAHSRFQIVKEKITPTLGYVFPLKNTTKFSEDLYVVIPESVNRYSRSGAGNQYVHGGASLQELIVPVIESTRKREEVSGLVAPTLVSKDLKVVSNILRLIIIQEEPVSSNLKERTITVGLYKDGELVSNEKELELNKVSEAATDRIFQFDLHLVSGGKMDSNYKLKVFDKSDKLNPLIEADVKNQTLIQTDF